MRKTIIILAVSIILLFFIGAFIKPAVETKPLAGMTNYDGLTIVPVDATDGLKLGSTGSTLVKFIKGTCDLTGPTIQATSSAFAACAATGVVSGDLVFVSLATSSAQAAISGVQASTTAGSIVVKLMNLSGAVAHTTAFGTSTSYWIIR